MAIDVNMHVVSKNLW